MKRNKLLVLFFALLFFFFSNLFVSSASAQGTYSCVSVLGSCQTGSDNCESCYEVPEPLVCENIPFGSSTCVGGNPRTCTLIPGCTVGSTCTSLGGHFTPIVLNCAYGSPITPCPDCEPEFKCCPNSGVGGGFGSAPSPSSCGNGGIMTAIGCIEIFDDDFSTFSTFLLRIGMGIAGGIALVLIFYGGFMVMTSAGNPQKLTAGKELITAAIMGLLLLVFAGFILRFVGVDILGLDQFGLGKVTGVTKGVPK